MIKNKIVPGFLNRETDKFAFGFYTSQTNAILARIESETGDEYLEVKLVDGVPFVNVKFETSPESRLYSVDRKFTEYLQFYLKSTTVTLLTVRRLLHNQLMKQWKCLSKVRLIVIVN
jgi:hypothetical protein